MRIRSKCAMAMETLRKPSQLQILLLQLEADLFHFNAQEASMRSLLMTSSV